MSAAAEIGLPRGAADLDAVRRLVLDYAAGLGFSLDFQGFDEEVATLPGKYAPPRGALFLARAGGAAVGTVGVRPIAPDIAEMKRLYVAPAHRGTGLGHRLADAAIGFAREAGYAAMRLDTLETMTAPMALYRSFGFVEIPAYYVNPVPGVRYFELRLRA
jgi:ribosomal protein S18 acetylase RimI-like enzyme